MLPFSSPDSTNHAPLSFDSADRLRLERKENVLRDQTMTLSPGHFLGAPHNEPGQRQLRETVTTDESEDRRSQTRKLGDDVKQLIGEVKPLTDLLPFVVKMAAFVGGALLIGYASKEHFFYDLSSISVVTLLIIVFFFLLVFTNFASYL